MSLGESFFTSFSGYRPAQWGWRGMNGTYRSQSRCPPIPTQSHNLLWIGTNDGECWPAIVTLHSMVLLCPKEVKPQGSVEKLGLWFSILIRRLVKKVCRCESKVSYFPQFIFKDPKCWLQAGIEPRLTTLRSCTRSVGLLGCEFLLTASLSDFFLSTEIAPLLYFFFLL